MGFLKENFRENYGPFDPVEGQIDGHDHMMIVGHQCEAIVAMIVRRSAHDRAAIMAMCQSFDGLHCVEMHQMCPRVPLQFAKIVVDASLHC